MSCQGLTVAPAGHGGASRVCPRAGAIGGLGEHSPVRLRMNRRCSSVPASPCAGRCSGLSQACCAASHAAGAAQVGTAAATLLTLLTCTREQRAGPRAGVADRASQRDGLCACFKRAPAPRCGWCRAAWQTRAPAARPGRACAVTPAAARAPRARWRPPAAAARRPRRRQSSTAAGAAARGWSACTAQGAVIMLVADALLPTLGAQAALAETPVTQEGGGGATRQAGRPASCLERHQKTGLKPGTRSSCKRTQSLQGAARLEHVVRLGAAQLAERVSFVLKRGTSAVKRLAGQI